MATIYVCLSLLAPSPIVQVMPTDRDRHLNTSTSIAPPWSSCERQHINLMPCSQMDQALPYSTNPSPGLCMPPTSHRSWWRASGICISRHQTPQHTASCGRASQMSGACSSGAAKAACTSAGAAAAVLARHRELLAAAAILLAAAAA